MGGLGPGIGGMEYVVIAVVALLVVGPERLPAMLNKLGKLVAKARNMAGQFRASFDEMARQSELDDLRKEVEALRQNQMVPLGAAADAAFRDIRNDLNAPLTPAIIAPDDAMMLTGPNEWPDNPPPLDAVSDTPPPKPRPSRARHASATKTAKAATKPKATPAKPPATTKPPVKARAKRKTAADA